MPYKNNYIKTVILKIDFESIVDFDYTKFSFLKEAYPIDKIQTKTDFITTLSQEKQSVDKRNYNEYRYYDNAMENCISISENAIFFEFKRRIPFTELKVNFNKIFDILKNNFHLESINRMGLRYVNNLNIHYKECKKYIAKELLANNTYIDSINKKQTKNNKFEKAMSLGQISLRNNDTVINFVFGNSNKYYPAILVDDDFLLDFDSYIVNLHKDSVIEKIDMLHNNIISLFEYSITDELRNLMNL